MSPVQLDASSIRHQSRLCEGNCVYCNVIVCTGGTIIPNGLSALEGLHCRAANGFESPIEYHLDSLVVSYEIILSRPHCRLMIELRCPAWIEAAVGESNSATQNMGAQKPIFLHSS